MQKENRIGGILFGLLAGGIVGSVIALLYAPSSGKKLRRKITDKAEIVLEDAEELYDTSKDKAEKLLKDGKKKASTILQDAKKKITSN